MFARVIERCDGGWCFWATPWARRSGAGDAGMRGRPRALLLALERGVLSSALECTARGHDQDHVPTPVYCIN